MEVVLTRTLPDDCLSRFRIRDMRPEETIKAVCDSVAEFNAAKRTAELVRKESKRTDGYCYQQRNDTVNSTITVYLTKEEEVPVNETRDNQSCLS